MQPHEPGVRRFKKVTKFMHQRSEGLRGYRGLDPDASAKVISKAARCDYCNCMTLTPHTIRIGRSTSTICPRCVQKNEDRYQSMVGVTATVTEASHE